MKQKQKKEVKKSNRRPLIAALALLFLIIGGFTLTRAYFLQHPLTVNSGDSNETNGLKPNLPLGINTTGGSIGNAVPVWGANLTESFFLPDGNNVWLEVQSNQYLYRGTLEGGAWQQKLILPPTATGVRMYTADTLVYFKPSTNTEDATFWAATSTGQEKIATLGLGWEFVSVFFEPTEKSFYYIAGSRDENYEIHIVTPDRQDFTLYVASNLAGSEILSVSAEANLLFFTLNNVQEGRKCLSLNLVDKQVAPIICGIVKQSRSDQNYQVQSTTPGNFRADTIQRLEKGEVSTGNISTLLTGKEGEFFNYLYANSGILTWLTSVFETNDAGQTRVSPRRLVNFDLAQNAQVAALEILPAEPVKAVAFDKEKMFWVLTSANGQEKLWKYVKTVQASTSTSSASSSTASSSSAPASSEFSSSATTSSAANDGFAWQEVSLNVCSAGCKYRFL